eukprot:UN01784
MSDALPKEATWNNYATHMIHTKTAQAASCGWIVGASDGVVYGNSPNAPQLSPEEAKELGSVGPGKGMMIAGNKYQTLRPFGDLFLLKKGKGGAIIAKGKKINLVAIITEEDGDKFNTQTLLDPMEKILAEFNKAGW